MELMTVKIISRNAAIRGKEFDVYYSGEGSHLNIHSIEDVTGTTDLKDIISCQALADIKFSLNEKLQMIQLRKLSGSFTPEQLNAGYISAAKENALAGYSND